MLDADSAQPIAARVYLQNAAGDWLFVSSASTNGSALPYREEWVPLPGCVERHTTVSAHPFRAELPPGEYTVEIERGKEFIPLRTRFAMADAPLEQTFRLRRWVNFGQRGWFSGETHVHRRIHELTNVMLAEDLNVVFPVTFWTVRSDAIRLQQRAGGAARLDAGGERRSGHADGMGVIELRLRGLLRAVELRVPLEPDCGHGFRRPPGAAGLQPRLRAHGRRVRRCGVRRGSP